MSGIREPHVARKGDERALKHLHAPERPFRNIGRDTRGNTTFERLSRLRPRSLDESPAPCGDRRTPDRAPPTRDRPTRRTLMSDVLLPLGFGVAASAATLLGGTLALRFQNRITLVLGLAAGVVLGVALFDLLPEALELSRSIYASRTIFGYVALGMSAYLLLDRTLGRAEQGRSRWRAHLGPASLTLHSFLDGMGIGLAFQVSEDIGWMVALAVLTHDLADGVNLVGLSLGGTEPGVVRRWLIVNGMAPLLGVAVGLLVRLPDVVLAPLLAIFGGVFLYIGASELVPRSHARDPRLRVTIASIAGVLLMLLVTHLAH